MIDFKGKRVVVLGLGVSGCAAAQLLNHHGADVLVSEKEDTQAHQAYAEELRDCSIEYELGGHSRARIEQADYIVISPGIPLTSEAASWARNKGIEILGEIEVGYSYCPAEIIAVTGTNGKTTTTTLIGEVLRQAGKNVFVLGNIGEPLCAHVSTMKEDDVVSLEVSSFQLETIKNFRPRVSVVLNLTPDHLDRYRNVKEYTAAKKRILMNQGKDDYFVFNWADDCLRSWAKETRAHAVCFNDDQVTRGALNANERAAASVAHLYGISLEVCLNVFKNFKGIEHRLEFVKSACGIDFINDSKATNIESTLWALERVTKPIILIAGGRDKGSDFSSIQQQIKKKVKTVVVFGEAKEKIQKALQSVVDVVEAGDLEEAVHAAYRRAEVGECILLSPMCASFDMFTNYKQRGNKFKEIVKAHYPS